MLALVLAETAAVLTLPLLTLPVALDSLPRLTMHARVEIAVARDSLQVSGTPDVGHADARLKIGYYFGVMAFDFVTTQIATGGQDYGEMSPLPAFGTSKGRAVGMALIGAGWTLLDRALVAHGHTKAAKALRFVLGAYAVNIVSWNLGWQSAWSADMLIPSQWRRDAAKPHEYAPADAYGVGQTQRAYDACIFMTTHPAKHLASSQCWK